MFGNLRRLNTQRQSDEHTCLREQTKAETGADIFGYIGNDTRRNPTDHFAEKLHRKIENSEINNNTLSKNRHIQFGAGNNKNSTKIGGIIGSRKSNI